LWLRLSEITPRLSEGSFFVQHGANYATKHERIVPDREHTLIEPRVQRVNGDPLYQREAQYQQ
jgi:hypothetical protein